MKKRMRQALALMLTAALITAGVPSFQSTAQAKSLKVTNVTGSKLTLYQGASFPLKTNSSTSGITFQSSKKAVASVSKAGLVLAKKKGKTKITVTNTKSNKTKKLTIQVKKSPYFTVSKKSGTYTSSIKVTLKAKKGYQLYYSTGSKFTSSNKMNAGKSKKITVSSNKKISLYAVKKGSKASLKKIWKNRLSSKFGAVYTYKINQSGNSDNENTSTPTTAPSITSPTPTTSSTPAPEVSTEPSASPEISATPTAEASATKDPAADDTDNSVTPINKAAPFTEEELHPIDNIDAIENAATITLSDSGWATSDTTNVKIKVSDSVTNELTGEKSASFGTATIGAPGIYIVNGSDTNQGSYQIKVKKGTPDVTLILNGITLQNSSTAPLLCNKDTTTTITLAKDSTNSITGPETYADYTDENESDTGAVILCKGYDISQSRLTINGSGTLNVTALSEDAIQSKGALRIGGGTIQVNSADDGIIGKDELSIAGGNLSITSDGDGLKASNDSDGLAFGFADISGGSISIQSHGDGIQVVTTLYIHENPVLDITTSKTVSTTDESMKGIKISGITIPSTDLEVDSSNYVYGLLQIDGGTISIDTTKTGSPESTADDAMNSNSDIEIKGGNITIEAADDAIHANGKLLIRNGEITISQSYEGLEAGIMYLDGGNIHVTASDDGINIAGGDSSTNKDNFQPDPWRPRKNNNNPSSSINNEYFLYINGGYIVVNASGDGLDSNGDIFMNDGTLYLFGPTNSGNAAIDYNCKFQLNGGTLLAAGYSGMAQGPDSSSTQYSLMMTHSSSWSAGTLLSIQDSGGNNILNCIPPKSYQNVVFSSPDLVKGSTYSIYTGGSVSGGEAVDYVYPTSVNYTQGTVFGSITLNSYLSSPSGSGTNKH